MRVRKLLFTILGCAWLALSLGSCSIAQEEPVQPASAKQFTTEAKALWRDGQLSQATAKLEAALEAEPDFTPAHQLLAVVLQQQGSLDDAVEHYWAVQRASFPALSAEATEDETRLRELVIQSERLLCLLTNKERMERKLQPYLPDPILAIIARQHSDEMRDLDYFSHDSPVEGYRTIKDRFLRVIERPRSYSIGENIACKYGRGVYSLNADNIHDTHQGWMDSPGHRANILNDGFEKIGIGVAANANGDYWATQFFARY